jgi:hypothetical protein
MAACALLLLAMVVAVLPSSAEDVQVDTALIVSVDVSNSVDEGRYKLQMEGIAKALEDPGVIDAIAGGPNGGILFSMVPWADRPSVAVPWTRITGKAEAAELANRIRRLPHQGGEFTCMTKMLRSMNDKVVPQIPGKAGRIIIDVSGDGPDNCNADEPIDTVRDELVANGVTINGLPILLDTSEFAREHPNVPGSDGLSTENWYKTHVMAGNGAFVLPAQGYGDFGRAIRQKFIVEISGISPAKKFSSAETGGGERKP